jgi:hypothetical protein
MTIIGTNHFVDRKAANKYYTQYGHTVTDVAVMIECKQIVLGKPKITKGQKLLIVDGGTRYAIQEGGI